MAEFALNTLKSAVPWLLDNGIRIVLIFAGAFFARKLAVALIDKLAKSIVASAAAPAEEAETKRRNTLIRIFAATLSVVVWILAGLMILQELGIAIAPLLASAGIVGLALGFGGQYLIRDLIGGLFIIMENQYRIGDVVNLDGTAGLVEDIGMRMTTLRDLDGVVHYVPHGEIKKVSNLSKNFARVNLNVGVSYSSNLEHVIAVVNRVGDEMAADPAIGGLLIKPPQFLRVDAFGDSSIDIKILGETFPLKQWEVAGELRKRLKIAFDKEGIEIPFPQRVVHAAPKQGE